MCLSLTVLAWLHLLLTVSVSRTLIHCLYTSDSVTFVLEAEWVFNPFTAAMLAAPSLGTETTNRSAKSEII